MSEMSSESIGIYVENRDGTGQNKDNPFEAKEKEVPSEIEEFFSDPGRRLRLVRTFYEFNRLRSATCYKTRFGLYKGFAVASKDS